MRDHSLKIEDLVEACSRLTRPGREVPLKLMAAIAKRTGDYDPGRSDLESRAMRAINDDGLPLPIAQYPLVRPFTEKDAFIDLAYPEHKLAIELDGWETHGLRDAFDRDRYRANELVMLGWRVIRFTRTMSNRVLCATIRVLLGL